MKKVMVVAVKKKKEHKELDKLELITDRDMLSNLSKIAIVAQVKKQRLNNSLITIKSNKSKGRWMEELLKSMDRQDMNPTSEDPAKPN